MFLWTSAFFYDPTDVGNLISGSSAFSKSSLNIWKLLVHILLKPGLENFEHNFPRMWDKCNCAVQLNILWYSLFFGIVMKPGLFQSCGHCWAFQTCLHIKCSTFTASYFRIWNSSAGIPSPPLVCSLWCFLKPICLCNLGCLALGEWSHHHGYLCH